MKLKIYWILFIGIVLCAACNNNDDETPSVTQELEGDWELVNVFGGFPGVNVNYESGLIAWDFNTEAGTLTVEGEIENDGPQSVYLPISSGTYEYAINEVNEETFLIIEGHALHPNGEYGNYRINSEGSLVIDQGHGSETGLSDVFVIILQRP